MSGTGSSSSSVTPFTVSQWHELEHQALIFKYLKAGHPVPPDLLVPIRTSLKFLSFSLFHHPTLGYCSYFGKKIDPEPGRCRRTDGKKWRCSKDAHLNSKYCERHMNRSRSRSRKPVESQNTSQSLSTVGLDIATGSSRGSGSGGGSLIFQKPPLHSVGTREGICFRSNMSLSHMDHIPYGIPNKEYSGQDRCLQELKPETDNGVLSVASESLRGFTMNSSLDSARRVTTSGSSSNPLSDQRDFFLQNSCLPMQMQQDFDLLMANDATSKQQQQHYFFGREFDSSRPLKQEHQSLQPLPNELPKTIDFGRYLDDQRANKNSLSTTQLSLPTPLASSKFFERGVHSSKDNFMDKFLS